MTHILPFAKMLCQDYLFSLAEDDVRLFMNIFFKVLLFQLKPDMLTLKREIDSILKEKLC